MPFQPGKSGNPAGRKVGTITKTARLRTLIEGHVPEIIQGLLTQAAAGDVSAAKLLLERALPPLRTELRPVPAAAPSEPRAIPQAVKSGILTAEQGQAMLDLAGKVAALEGLAGLQERLAKLEALLAQR